MKLEDIICIKCNQRPMQIKKHKLCRSCYQKQLGATLHSNGNVQCNEEVFVKSFFTHDDWIFKPCILRLDNGKRYEPDFYDKRRGVFIEVIGTRQAFHYNKDRYKTVSQSFPSIILEFRLSNGDLLNIDNKGHFVWSRPEEYGYAQLYKLNAFDRFQDPNKNIGQEHHSAKLRNDQVLAIRKDPRTLSAIANDYGIHWQEVHRIKHKKSWASLEPDFEIDDRRHTHSSKSVARYYRR